MISPPLFKYTYFYMLGDKISFRFVLFSLLDIHSKPALSLICDFQDRLAWRDTTGKKKPSSSKGRPKNKAPPLTKAPWTDKDQSGWEKRMPPDVYSQPAKLLFLILLLEFISQKVCKRRQNLSIGRLSHCGEIPAGKSFSMLTPVIRLAKEHGGDGR